MKVDVLLERVLVAENGSTRKSCPGLVLVKFFPVGEVQQANAGGRKVDLQDNVDILYSGYQAQFELRANVTGRSWIEVQVISVIDFGALGKLIIDLLALGKKSWPLPVGTFLIDAVSEDVKKGAPQVVAFGKSGVLSADSIIAPLRIDMEAPSDVLDYACRDPVTNMPVECAQRSVLLEKGKPNGSVFLSIEAA